MRERTATPASRRGKPPRAVCRLGPFGATISQDKHVPSRQTRQGQKRREARRFSLQPARSGFFFPCDKQKKKINKGRGRSGGSRVNIGFWCCCGLRDGVAGGAAAGGAACFDASEKLIPAKICAARRPRSFSCGLRSCASAPRSFCLLCRPSRAPL